VVSGELALERDGRQIDLLRRGETLGALSLMAGRAVRSRAVALTPVLVMRIDAAQLEAMSSECQLAFQKVFNRDLLRQLAAASAAASRERDEG